MRHFPLGVPTGYHGSLLLSVHHHGCMLSCHAGSQCGILLAWNGKYSSMVEYPAYSFTPRLHLDTSMPHKHPCPHGFRISMKSGDFCLESRTHDSANRRSTLNRCATVACIWRIPDGEPALQDNVLPWWWTLNHGIMVTHNSWWGCKEKNAAIFTLDS
jgi:hypothetical protein